MGTCLLVERQSQRSVNSGENPIEVATNFIVGEVSPHSKRNRRQSDRAGLADGIWAHGTGSRVVSHFEFQAREADAVEGGHAQMAVIALDYSE